MMQRLLPLAFVLVLAPCLRGEPDKPKDIEKLIQQLGDQDFTLREQASLALQKIGVPALEQLRKAENNADLEIARRAKRAVEYIETHDPKLSKLRKEKHIAMLIECLGGTNYVLRQQATQELQQIGQEALPALEKAAASSPNNTIKVLARNLANVIKRQKK